MRKKKDLLTRLEEEYIQDTLSVFNIEKRINEMPPSGGLYTRKLYGKDRTYHQYYVDGKLKADLIQPEECGEIRALIRRKQKEKEKIAELKNDIKVLARALGKKRREEADGKIAEQIRSTH